MSDEDFALLMACLDDYAAELNAAKAAEQAEREEQAA